MEQVSTPEKAAIARHFGFEAINLTDEMWQEVLLIYQTVMFDGDIDFEAASHPSADEIIEKLRLEDYAEHQIGSRFSPKSIIQIYPGNSGVYYFDFYPNNFPNHKPSTPIGQAAAAAREEFRSQVDNHLLAADIAVPYR